MLKNKPIFYFTTLITALMGITLSFFAFGNGDPDDTPIQEMPDIKEGWVYAFVEYEHDWADPKTAFLKIMAHPKSKVPRITGGYSQTDVFAFVRIRGIDAPRAMHHDSVRHRPHRFIERERARWNRAMRYTWNITQPTRTLRLHNLKVVKCDDYLKKLTGEQQILEADWEFWLGGAWHNLAVSMIQDENARPLQEDVNWDSGTRNYNFENPNVPK